MGKNMGTSFSRISRWFWYGKNNHDKSSSSNECGPLGENKPVSFKLPTATSPLLMRLNSKEEMRIDGEYDAVLVPSDGGGGLSESESGELDWSIGWLESFSPEFHSDDENDASYAVLVPCYRPVFMKGSGGTNNMFGNVIKGISRDYSAEGRKYMEQWLSTLQGC